MAAAILIPQWRPPAARGAVAYVGVSSGGFWSRRLRDGSALCCGRDACECERTGFPNCAPAGRAGCTLVTSTVGYVDRVLRDPYRVLGISRGASAAEVHDAYRAMVKLHHPDRNGSSADRRAGSRRSRRPMTSCAHGLGRRGHGGLRSRPSPTGWRRSNASSVTPSRRASARGGRLVTPSATPRSPAPVSTEDSFGKILGDIRDELGDRIRGAAPAPRRAAGQRAD